jgi:hypothetical protein
MKQLKINKNFKPCSVETDDELYPNGIFEFNITRMSAYLQKNPEAVPVEAVEVCDIYWGTSSLNESHLNSVDVSRPVILAEIAPGRYNVIDGNHRVEKAHRMGMKSVPAYRVPPEKHMQFLTSQTAYRAYVAYWNDKLRDRKSC